MHATDDIKLSALLKPKSINLDLKGKDKVNIITELVDLVGASGKVKNKKALVNALVEREKLGSTAIGKGVAIPHTKIEGVGAPILAFGRCGEGVDFNSLDGEKTRIFFILISSKEDVGIHLKILAKISHIIKDKFAVGLFKKAKNKDEILKIMASVEKHL
ncbi:MAG: PTS sugar transporter subunit IIA [Candidatus Omnitrophica bacterium]|nr:PTS sugar transporter subunit IIA [Candidatus Omnitrophota bacterium]